MEPRFRVSFFNYPYYNLSFAGAKVVPFFWIPATKSWQNDERRAFFDAYQAAWSDALMYVKGIWLVMSNMSVLSGYLLHYDTSVSKLRTLSGAIFCHHKAHIITTSCIYLCQWKKSVCYLYISLPEIFVFPAAYYFFENIANMKKNRNLLIIRCLWFLDKMMPLRKIYSCTTITPIVVQP